MRPDRSTWPGTAAHPGGDGREISSPEPIRRGGREDLLQMVGAGGAN